MRKSQNIFAFAFCFYSNGFWKARTSHLWCTIVIQPSAKPYYKRSEYVAPCLGQVSAKLLWRAIPKLLNAPKHSEYQLEEALTQLFAVPITAFAILRALPARSLTVYFSWTWVFLVKKCLSWHIWLLMSKRFILWNSRKLGSFCSWAS